MGEWRDGRTEGREKTRGERLLMEDRRCLDGILHTREATRPVLDVIYSVYFPLHSFHHDIRVHHVEI